MSDATSAFGTLLKQGDAASPEVFTTVAEVRNITFGPLTTELIDVTNHDSANNHREKIASLRDSGECTFTINYLPDNATHINSAGGLLATYVARTARNWTVDWTDPTPTTWAFTGVITSFGVNAPIDDALTADVTIGITAAVTPV